LSQETGHQGSSILKRCIYSLQVTYFTNVGRWIYWR